MTKQTQICQKPRSGLWEDMRVSAIRLIFSLFLLVVLAGCDALDQQKRLSELEKQLEQQKEKIEKQLAQSEKDQARQKAKSEQEEAEFQRLIKKHQEIAERYSKLWPRFRNSPQLTGEASLDISPPLELVWVVEVGSAVKTTTAIKDNHLFFGTEKGEVQNRQLTNGELIWTFKTEGPIESSPLLRDRAVYIGSSDFYFYCLDEETGELKWKYKTDNKILGSANYWWNEDEKEPAIFFGSYDHHLYKLRADTGDKIASFKTENYIHATPAFLEMDSPLALGACDGHIYLLDSTNLSLRHKIDAGAYIGASVCLDEENRRGFVGTYGKEVLAFDLKTGDILWRFKSNFPFFSSAAYDGKRGQIYIGGRDKKLHALDAKTGEQKWSFTTRGRVDSNPVLSGDYVYVGSDDGRLYAVHAKTGEEAWSYDLGGRVSAEPAIAGGYLVIGSASGKVFAFQRKESTGDE